VGQGKFCGVEVHPYWTNIECSDAKDAGKKDRIAIGRSRQRSSDYFSVYFKIVLTIFHYNE